MHRLSCHSAEHHHHTVIRGFNAVTPQGPSLIVTPFFETKVISGIGIIHYIYILMCATATAKAANQCFSLSIYVEVRYLVSYIY